MFAPVWENYMLKSGEGLSLGFILLWMAGDITNLVGGFMAGLLPTMIILATYVSSRKRQARTTLARCKPSIRHTAGRTRGVLGEVMILRSRDSRALGSLLRVWAGEAKRTRGLDFMHHPLIAPHSSVSQLLRREL